MSVVHPLHQYETPEADSKKYLHTYANVMTICVIDIDTFCFYLFFGVFLHTGEHPTG